MEQGLYKGEPCPGGRPAARGAGGPARLGAEASRHRSPYGLKCLALGPEFCLVILTIGRFVFVCLFFPFLGGAPHHVACGILVP